MVLFRIVCCYQSERELRKDRIQKEAQMVNEGADCASGSLGAFWQAV